MTLSFRLSAFLFAGLYLGCGILDSDKNMVFVVQEIDGKTIPEWSAIFSGDIYPKRIIISNFEDFNFQGRVEFHEIGTHPIKNYGDHTASRNKFYIDTQDILMPIEWFIFSNLAITRNDILTGYWAPAGSTIDTGGFSFFAVRP